MTDFLDTEIGARLWQQNRLPDFFRAYTGPNVRLGDYFVREIAREGTEHRQIVVFEVVGTGRTERMSRTEFERKARSA